MDVLEQRLADEDDVLQRQYLLQKHRDLQLKRAELEDLFSSVHRGKAEAAHAAKERKGLVRSGTAPDINVRRKREARKLLPSLSTLNGTGTFRSEFKDVPQKVKRHTVSAVHVGEFWSAILKICIDDDSLLSKATDWDLSALPMPTLHAVSEGSKFWEDIPMQDGRFFFLTSFLNQNWHTYVSAADWRIFGEMVLKYWSKGHNLALKKLYKEGLLSQRLLKDLLIEERRTAGEKMSGYRSKIDKLASESAKPWNCADKAKQMCAQIEALSFGLFGKPRLQHAVFCIDSSGSMHGRLGRISEDMEYLLKKLPTGSKINICTYSPVNVWRKEMQYNSQEVIAEATEYVRAIRATSHESSLLEVLDGVITDIDVDTVYILSDGDVGVDTTGNKLLEGVQALLLQREEELAACEHKPKSMRKLRMHTVAFDAPEKSLNVLKKLSSFTGGRTIGANSEFLSALNVKSKTMRGLARAHIYNVLTADEPPEGDADSEGSESDEDDEQGGKEEGKEEGKEGDRDEEEEGEEEEEEEAEESDMESDSGDEIEDEDEMAVALTPEQAIATNNFLQQDPQIGATAGVFTGMCSLISIEESSSVAMGQALEKYTHMERVRDSLNIPFRASTVEGLTEEKERENMRRQQRVDLMESSIADGDLLYVCKLVDGGEFSIDYESTVIGVTPLMQAAAHGKLQDLQQMLQRGATIDYVSRMNKETALTAAGRNGHTAVVQALVRGGAAVDLHLPNDDTALSICTEALQVDVVRVLLGAGAGPVESIKRPVESINRPVESVRGTTPLMIAAKSNNRQLLNAFIRSASDRQTAVIDHTANHENEMTVLMYAAASMNLGLVQVHYTLSHTHYRSHSLALSLSHTPLTHSSHTLLSHTLSHTLSLTLSFELPSAHSISPVHSQEVRREGRHGGCQGQDCFILCGAQRERGMRQLPLRMRRRREPSRPAAQQCSDRGGGARAR
jgi:hypothetical protein